MDDDDGDILEGWYHQIWVGPAGASLVGMVKGLRMVERRVETIVRFGLSFRKGIDDEKVMRLLY